MKSTWINKITTNTLRILNLGNLYSLNFGGNGVTPVENETIKRYSLILFKLFTMVEIPSYTMDTVSSGEHFRYEFYWKIL
jgi:hypothetical protein